MDLKTTIKAFSESDVKATPGIEQQAMRRLVGTDLCPSERIRVTLASFEAGMKSPFHWFLIEACFYVVSGRGLVRDIEGKTHDVGPGSVVYVSPGIAASFEWEFTEPTKLLSIRGTTDPEKNIQFNIADKSKMESSIELDYLVKRGGTKLPSFY